MASNKRERELARAKYERQQARRAEQAARKRRIYTIIASIAGVAIVVALFASLALRQSSSNSAADAAATATAAPSDTAAASPSPSTSSTFNVSCKPAPAARPDDKKFPTAPPETIKTTGSYTMTLATNCGTIELALDNKTAPITTNSMVYLASQKFFDLTSCHRLTTEGIYVLQCGDPAGNGSGGPGYKFADENLPKNGANNYPTGTVAMANSGPGTNGSQFFLVYKDTTLPPNYTIWGKITAGLDIVQYVASQGVKGGGGDGAPNQPVTIETATTTYTAGN